MKCEEIKKEFIKILNGLSQKYNREQVWNDFIIMFACAISNVSDNTFYKEREAMYMKSIKEYEKEELIKFADMFALLVQTLQMEMCQDFLGKIYSELKLSKDWKKQYFSPVDVTRLMGYLTTNVDEQIKENGIITVEDNCCGSGSQLIAFASILHEKNINYQRCVLFFAQDIDLIAGLMCYIQLSVLGCKAYVKIGNALTEPITTNEKQTENIWLTPMYKLDYLFDFITSLKNQNTNQI